MRYKKTLLVAFFLSLFVLQQTQVSARFSTNEKNELQPSIIHANGIPAQLYITVAHLDDDNYPKYENGTMVKCESGDTLIEIYLQNTSTTAWNADDIEVGYHWGDGYWQLATLDQSFPAIPAGNEFPGLQPQQAPLVITVIPPSISGSETYTLHLDLRRKGGAWFSLGGWPDAQIAVTVTGGATATPTATAIQSTLVPNLEDLPAFPFLPN
ncbi:MAG: hypothetical protein HY869_16365 [Chloroflexi bacterium]|nr:hypothetical protein [Chloroflexota bacterium]